MRWRAIPYEHLFRSSTAYNLGTILRVCVVTHVEPDRTRCRMYIRVHALTTHTDRCEASVKRMPMDMPDFALPVTSESSLPCVYGITVVCLFAFLYCYVACSVRKSLCFHANGQRFFCRLRNHDYDMAINLMIVLMSYTSVELGRSDVSFLAAICF